MKAKYYSSPARFIPPFLSIFFILLLCQSITESVHAQWTQHIIDPKITKTTFIDANDIDSDGDIDMFVTEEYGGSVFFYENINNISWTKQIVATHSGVPASPVGLDLADFNNDGNMDIVVGWYLFQNIVAWYKNNGGDPVQWTENTIDNSYDGPTRVVAEDINGDNAIDVVVKWWDSGEFIWYENKLPEKWAGHIIGTNMKGIGAFDVADINDDNKPDIVRAVENRNDIILFLNNLPDTNWTEIILDDQLPGARDVNIADIDNDGDMDIAATSQEASDSEPDIVWYENDGSGQSWIKHPVISYLAEARFLRLVDLDLNGYADIVVTVPPDNDVIFLLNEDGGTTWKEYVVDDNFTNPQQVRAYDIDLDGYIDIVPTRDNVDYTDSFVWYENPLHSAYPASLEVSPYLIQSQNDTLIVNATLYIPDNHPANAWAIINGEQSGFVDTLQLLDDGLHSDGDSLDQIWGNRRLTTDLPEDEYHVDVFSYDSSTYKSFGFHTRFITLGPVEYNGYSAAPDFLCNKTVPEPGGCLNMKLKLMNKSSTATATNISAELISLDTLISFFSNNSDFPDIPAGDSSVSQNNFTLLISEDWPGDETIPIQVNISSYGIVCWQDTFFIHVDTSSGTNVYNVKAPIIRIYPNPTDDILTIELERVGFYEIDITSINGKTLYRGRMEGTSHQIDLSSFQKGVYLITMRSKDFIETRKLIKLE